MLNKSSSVAYLLSLTALVFLQGGYYSGPTCLIGVLAGAAALGICLIAFIKQRDIRLSPAPIAFFLIGSCALLSAFINGAADRAISEAMPWFCVSALALLCDQACEDEGFLDWFVVFGLVLSVFAVLMASGFFPYPGSMNANRLQFTFQYANTAGIFFAVFSILSLCYGSKRYSVFSVLPIIAMFFTRSIGTYCVFALAMLILLVTWLKKEEYFRMIKSFVSLLIAGIASMGCIFFGSELSFLFTILAICANWAVESRLCDQKKLFSKTVAYTLSGIVALVLVLGALYLLPERLAQASLTFTERMEQIKDAIAFVVRYPLFGLGPDGWSQAYPMIQTSDYISYSIHDSYLQVWLDAGLLGFVLIVAVLGLGLWSAFRAKQTSVFVCILMIVVHLLFDFDLQFSAFDVVLVFLLCLAFNGEDRLVIPYDIRKWIALLLSILVVIDCVFGIVINDRIDVAEHQSISQSVR